MTPAAAREIFRAERAKFAAFDPRVLDARLVILDRPCIRSRHCRARDLALADLDTLEITLLARALRLPRNHVVGLLRHELGHLCDPWPGRRGAEQRADDLAEYVTGERIRYDDRDVQTVGRGRWPRPKYLHR